MVEGSSCVDLVASLGHLVDQFSDCCTVSQCRYGEFWSCQVCMGFLSSASTVDVCLVAGQTAARQTHSGMRASVIVEPLSYFTWTDVSSEHHVTANQLGL